MRYTFSFKFLLQNDIILFLEFNSKINEMQTAVVSDMVLYRMIPTYKVYTMADILLK